MREQQALEVAGAGMRAGREARKRAGVPATLTGLRVTALRGLIEDHIAVDGVQTKEA